MADLYEQMDALMALHRRVYQVFAPGGTCVGIKPDLATALDMARPCRGIVIEADRGGAARAFDHTGKQLSI